MFKAPAFGFSTASTDFLLTRHASGRMSLREFQGAVAVGQQEPHIRVPAPQSKEKRYAHFRMSNGPRKPRQDEVRRTE